MLVDSHCHLDFPDFAAEIDAVVARAKAAGVARMVTIDTRLRQFDRVKAIAERFDEVYCSVGTHPHNAAEEPDATVGDYVAAAAHRKVVAIGEAGLDFHYDKSPRDLQAASFRTQIAAARETGLPLVIHTREAEAETEAILREEMAKGRFDAILHCFSSGPGLARAGVELGLYVSFSGILTFKRSEELREIAASVPAERLLVETDAPYLAPVPHRGHRNEPAYVVETARVLAETRGVSAEGDRPGDDRELLSVVFQGSRAGGLRGRMTTVATILGCGSSGGVPRVASGWGACDPANPRNRRRRCSLLVEKTGPNGVTTVLVDTSPDLRDQLLSTGTVWIDGVLFTHDHADHTHGIDDLRPIVIQNRRRVSVYLEPETGERIKERFSYCFDSAPGSPYPPILDAHDILPPTPVVIEGEGGAIVAEPYPVVHGPIVALGFRFGGLAYTPDVSDIPEESQELLEGLDVLILDALRVVPHISHLTVDEALMWIERLAPRRAILTNMHVDLDYETLKRRLPDNVEPAYDGMRIEIADPA